jgi:hypothetical protein
MVKFTKSEVRELIELAVEDVVETAVAEMTTVNCIRIMLGKYGLDVESTVTEAIAKVKANNIMIKSADGFPGSGRFHVRKSNERK